MKTYSSLARAASLIIGAVWLQAVPAQIPASQGADASALAPPIDHESGTIDDVLTADDGGFRLRGYIVTWRGSHVFVSGEPAKPLAVGATVGITVYRSNVNGLRGLRFAVAQAGDPNVAQDETRNSEVSITSGTAKVAQVLAADNDGYSFIAYLVNWHDGRVAVVDPQLHTPKVVGDQINFRVFHTGANENRQLSFVLNE